MHRPRRHQSGQERTGEALPLPRLTKSAQAEPELGALLPCHVVVRRGKDATGTTIQAIDPRTMVQLSGNPAVREGADDADTRLRKALVARGSAAQFPA